MTTLRGWLQIAALGGLALALAGIMIFGVALMIDRNRGESGIAASPFSAAMKICFGILILSSAGGLVTWLI